MRMGEHRAQLAASSAAADKVYWFQPAGMDWSMESIVAQSPVPAAVVSDIDELVLQVAADAKAGDQLVVMSNGGFGGIHQKLLDKLQDKISL